MGHIVVELGVAGGRAEDVGVPGTHGPAGGEVGVQGDGVGVVLDGLQVVEELVGGGGSFGDAGLLPDPLVVGHAVGVAAVGDAVDLAVKGLVADEVVDGLEGVHIPQRDKVAGEVGLGDAGGDEADVAPLAGHDAQGEALLVIGQGLVGDGDVGVELVELLGIAGVDGVHNVGAVGQDLDVGGDILEVLAQFDLVDGGQAGGSFSRAAAGGCGRAVRPAAGGQGAGGRQNAGSLQKIAAIDLAHKKSSLFVLQAFTQQAK